MFEENHRPVFVYTHVLVMFGILVYELYVNNQNRTEENPCPVPLGGVLCLEDFATNPFLGPSAETLFELGAKNGHSVVTELEWSRLFTCMYLHGGLVHWAFNMLALLQLGRGIEQSYG